MKRILFLLIILFLSTFVVNAKYVQTSKAKYRQDFGWSKYYEVEVTYISGTELNKATNTFNYAAYATYAVIFWGDDKATVIKLTTYTTCGTEVKKECITNVYNNLQGEDQQGKQWEICVTNYCY